MSYLIYSSALHPDQTGSSKLCSYCLRILMPVERHLRNPRHSVTEGLEPLPAQGPFERTSSIGRGGHSFVAAADISKGFAVRATIVAAGWVRLYRANPGEHHPFKAAVRRRIRAERKIRGVSCLLDIAFYHKGAIVHHPRNCIGRSRLSPVRSDASLMPSNEMAYRRRQRRPCIQNARGRLAFIFRSTRSSSDVSTSFIWATVISCTDAHS